MKLSLTTRSVRVSKAVLARGVSARAAMLHGFLVTSAAASGANASSIAMHIGWPLRNVQRVLAQLLAADLVEVDPAEDGRMRVYRAVPVVEPVSTRRRGTRRRKISARARRALIDLYQGRCAYCLEPVSAETAALDHVDPLALGGADNESNLVPACGPCNSSKGATPLFAWMSRRAAERARA